MDRGDGRPPSPASARSSRARVISGRSTTASDLALRAPGFPRSVVLMGMSSDVAKQVRAALKARGLGPRQVSVRNDSYSMGSTVRVRIKVWAVALREVEATARPFERVTRDESTGEILCGGNTHIDVAYESEAIAEVAPIISRALAAGAHTFGTVELTDSDTHAGEADAYDAGADGKWIALLARDRSGPYLTRILAARGELAAVLAELAQP